MAQKVLKYNPENEKPGAINMESTDPAVLALVSDGDDDYHRYKALNQRAKQHEEGEANWLVSYADMMTLLVGFFVLLLSFSKIDANKYEQIKRETIKTFGGEYKVPFEKLSGKVKEIVEKEKLSDQVLFHETDDGLEVTFRGALFFDSGSTLLKEQAQKLLNQLIPTLSAQAKEYGILVEGHTDNRPVSGGIYPTNWELSSVRACTVLRMFEAQGFDASRLRAQGWGDKRPVVPNEDEHGNQLPANQAQNRRVVIRILRNSD